MHADPLGPSGYEAPLQVPVRTTNHISKDFSLLTLDCWTGGFLGGQNVSHRSSFLWQAICSLVSRSQQTLNQPDLTE